MHWPPEPEPQPQPEPLAVSAWDIEKAANRLAKQVEKVESGRWLPRLPFKLNGLARKELHAARALLHEGRTIMRETT